MKHFLLAVALICFGSPALAQDVPAVAPAPEVVDVVIPLKPEPAPLPAAPAALAPKLNGAYFKTLLSNPSHPYVSLGSNFTTKGEFDGMTSQVALIWHKGDPTNTLIPDFALNAGIKPFSWTLVACGAGYGNGSGVLTCGSSINVAPTLFGPLAQALKLTSNPVANAVATFIAGAPNGSGLALGYTWHMEPVAQGALKPFNQWGSHVDAFVGAGYMF